MPRSKVECKSPRPHQDGGSIPPLALGPGHPRGNGGSIPPRPQAGRPVAGRLFRCADARQHGRTPAERDQVGAAPTGTSRFMAPSFNRQDGGFLNLRRRCDSFRGYQIEVDADPVVQQTGHKAANLETEVRLLPGSPIRPRNLTTGADASNVRAQGKHLPRAPR